MRCTRSRGSRGFQCLVCSPRPGERCRYAPRSNCNVTHAMSFIAQSSCVIAIAFTVGWLVAANLYIQFNIQLPFAAWQVFYIICRRGFANHDRIRTHCGWTALGGGILGLMISPQIWTTGRLSITEELFGMYHGYGLVNSSLIGAAALISLFAVLECLNSSNDDPIRENSG